MLGLSYRGLCKFFSCETLMDPLSLHIQVLDLRSEKYTDYLRLPRKKKSDYLGLNYNSITLSLHNCEKVISILCSSCSYL